ncbi:TraX family protein [Cellulosilyticum sp. I15G10I2]|uniref:TraX family protein n=1 Tax=Cellulosilyticum sp. I15G10I2 TaxID=1892843 RepID=UPI00085C8F71|nr:TraX family protein [Cellulosilyticum sp. I15G10I2]
MLKIIAAALMLIDHLGMVFFQDQFGYRIIGRLSMPIFAYCVAQGFYKTTSYEKYFERMGVFAIVSQIPFWMMMYVTNPVYFNFMHFNIGFTFLGALCTLRLYKTIRNHTCDNKMINILGINVILILTTLLRCDYGAYAICLVLVFYEFYIMRKDILLTFIMLAAATFSLFFIGRADQIKVQLLGLPAFLIIIALKDLPLKQFKYFFYIFYPLHMLVLSFIKWVQ